VQVISVETGDTGRDEHLRSPDFFDAARFPEMNSQSTAVEHLDGGVYKTTGDLTIKGTTREVEVDATVEGTGEDPWGNQRVGIAIRGEIDRTDFGLNFQQKLAGGKMLVGEQVRIRIDVSAVRAG
jgi:polyisoprenoid-binding protein YceI